MQCVIHDFFHALGRQIQGALTDGVGLDSEQAKDCVRIYLTEDADIVTQREDLNVRKLRSKEVLKKLFMFDIKV